MSTITFSSDQQKAYDVLMTGKSAFITGGAGTGKSTLTEYFCRQRKIARLATTGAAALLIHGQTVHSFFGLPSHIHNPRDILDGVRDVHTSVVKRLASFDGVMIDEISMLRIDQFQAVMEMMTLAARIRNKRAFQLIGVGDFGQLRPVVNQEEIAALRHAYGNRVFSFEHASWPALSYNELSVIHRQSADSEFAHWLSGVRRGQIGDMNFINSRVAKAPYDTVRLVTTNAAASDINNKMMRSLNTPDVTLRGRTTGKFNFKNMRVPESYTMRVGARVIICKNNQPNGYVNGSTGTLMGFGKSQKDGQPIAHVKLDNGKQVQVTEAVWEEINYQQSPNGGYEPVVKGAYKNMPLLPGWAITIHRSQGMSLDRAHVDLSRVFTTGQAYVALSRVTSIEGLTLAGKVKEEDLYPDAKVAAYYAKMAGEHEPEIPFAM